MHCCDESSASAVYFSIHAPVRVRPGYLDENCEFAIILLGIELENTPQKSKTVKNCEISLELALFGIRLAFTPPPGIPL